MKCYGPDIRPHYTPDIAHGLETSLPYAAAIIFLLNWRQPSLNINIKKKKRNLASTVAAYHRRAAISSPTAQRYPYGVE